MKDLIIRVIDMIKWSPGDITSRNMPGKVKFPAPPAGQGSREGPATYIPGYNHLFSKGYLVFVELILKPKNTYYFLIAVIEDVASVLLNPKSKQLLKWRLILITIW